MKIINGITTIIPKIYIDKIYQGDIDFLNDELSLYVTDRKFNLNKFLKYKKEIKKYILYSEKIYTPVIIDKNDEYSIKYDDVHVRFDSYKYSTFGNLVVYNESRNYIMSMMLLNENIFLRAKSSLFDKIIGTNTRTFIAQDICFKISKCLMNN